MKAQLHRLEHQIKFTLESYGATRACQAGKRRRNNGFEFTSPRTELSESKELGLQTQEINSGLTPARTYRFKPRDINPKSTKQQEGQQEEQQLQPAGLHPACASSTHDVQNHNQEKLQLLLAALPSPLDVTANAFEFHAEAAACSPTSEHSPPSTPHISQIEDLKIQPTASVIEVEQDVTLPAEGASKSAETSAHQAWSIPAAPCAITSQLSLISECEAFTSLSAREQHLTQSNLQAQPADYSNLVAKQESTEPDLACIASDQANDLTAIDFSTPAVAPTQACVQAVKNARPGSNPSSQTLIYSITPKASSQEDEDSAAKRRVADKV